MGRSSEGDAQLASLTALSPSGCALGLRICFPPTLIMFQTYGSRWAEICSAQGYFMCDPLVTWGFAQHSCRRQSALHAPDPRNILPQALPYASNLGVAASQSPNVARSIAGVARPDREFFDDEIAQISDLVRVLRQEITPPEQLSTAQVEALRLIANGYRHADATTQLAISESALKARLRTARKRLLCRTTAEAIQRAAANKLF